MKRLFLIFLASLLISPALFAQEKAGATFKKKFSTGLDIFTDVVMDAPDGIDFRTINQGVSLYGLYTYPIKKSNFALAIGVGLGMHNLFSNGMLGDTSGVSFLSEIPKVDADNNNVDYKKSKISITYLDFPAELRFKSKNGIRFAVGAKVGVLMNAHTKYKGDDLTDGSKTKVKEGELPNFETWRFGPTLQIGYKWINLTGYYSVTKIFKKNFGPDIYPVSIGISLRPF